jgi:hypothetical protein
VQDVDRAGVLVDGVDDPVLGSTADPKEIGAVRRAGECEVAPRQRRFPKIDGQDAIEPFDLLDREVLAVLTE